MKRILLTFLTLCLISTSVLANQAEDKIKDAVSLYNSGRYAECIKNLNTVISQDPSYPVAYYYLGLSYAKTNKKDLAIQNYDKVISTSSDKSLKSMAKAAKDCLGTSGFTAIDAQLSISNESNAQKVVPLIKKEEPIKQVVENKIKKDIVPKTEKTQDKMPSNAEIGAAIMTLKKAGLWNGSMPATTAQAPQTQNSQKSQQDMMAKMYMEQMKQQMNNPAYLMMNMTGNNNNFNNNNMMNMLPFLMSNQGGDSNPRSNQQLIQTMMMSQMMPNLDFSSNDNNR